VKNYYPKSLGAHERARDRISRITFVQSHFSWIYLDNTVIIGKWLFILLK